VAPVNTLLSLLIMLTQANSSLDCGDISALIDRVDRDFRQGSLQTAISEADHALSCPNATVDERVMLHLKLSGIHDRTGLHTNSRPVRAALQSIDSASELADQANPASLAAIKLARSRYYYRSEEPDSDYPTARRFARAALTLFEELQDLHGQADTVHLTGLFHLQREELDQARVYFERSLALEVRSAAARPIMLADYERHMGFIYQMSGDLEQAIKKFQRSFVIRRDNGLTDQAMFAAASLGRALIYDNRAAEAEAPLVFALDTAEALDSPEGRARAGLALGQMHEQLGNREAAIEAFEATLVAAEEINRTSIIERASAALGRLLEAQ
jgi:tetratricopeptide (TPR) repeat protein